MSLDSFGFPPGFTVTIQIQVVVNTPRYSVECEICVKVCQYYAILCQKVSGFARFRPLVY